MPAKLTDKEIQEILATLAGWSYRDASLVKRFPTARYMDGIRFVEALAVDAEARDHHPDLLVRYGDVTVFLSTHSEGGVTRHDADAASAVEAIARTLGLA